VQHLVSFHPGATRSLFGELEARGHRLTWDLVMELEATAPGDHGRHRVEELPPGPELWGRVHASLRLFGVDGPVAEQLTAMERDVLAPGGKRWFGVRGPEGSIDSLGAFLVLDEVGYLDNIATFEGARRRGLASAVTAAVAGAATASGASHVVVLADPADRAVVGMYERLGFRGVGMLASTRGAIAR
jgi:ribosomal protein S18 acetylase RimI-like enzyme